MVRLGKLVSQRDSVKVKDPYGRIVDVSLRNSLSRATEILTTVNHGGQRRETLSLTNFQVGWQHATAPSSILAVVRIALTANCRVPALRSVLRAVKRGMAEQP